MTNSTDNIGFVKLLDGVEVPVKTLPSPTDIVIGHGLGSDPSEKHFYNDISYDLWTDALSNLSSASSNGTAVFYTSRGHGDSRGWEKCPTSTFQWPSLAEDMWIVANTFFHDSPFVVLGQSMGSAAALYMAISHPNRLRGLILIRPPRAWEARKKASHSFVEAAEALTQQKQNTSFHLPLLAASTTDLPTTGYEKIACPVLILSHGQDEAHPVETGRILSEKIPQSRLEVAANEEEARNIWPKIIASWMQKEGLVVGGGNDVTAAKQQSNV